MRQWNGGSAIPAGDPQSRELPRIESALVLVAAKNHVNTFLYDGASAPDPEGIIIGRQEIRPPGPLPSDRAKLFMRAPSPPSSSAICQRLRREVRKRKREG